MKSKLWEMREFIALLLFFGLLAGFVHLSNRPAPPCPAAVVQEGSQP